MKCRCAWLAAAITILPLSAHEAVAETIGVFTKASGNPIARAVRAGAEQVAKANGITLFHFIPTSPDNIPQQQFLVDEAIRQKRDAVVFTPVDIKAMVPSVEKFNAAGIPVINISDRISGGQTVSFIGNDDYSIAVDTARVLFKAMNGKGNLVVLEGPANVPTAVARSRGFKDALKDFPDIKVVLSKDAQYARPAALDLMRAMLKAAATPVDGVLAANDAMAFGAIQAFKDAKKTLPPVVSINASKEAVDMIKAGDMLASGDDNGLIEGCLGTEIAIHVLRKETVPKEVMAKTEVVTKANLAAYEIPAEKRPCPSLASMTGK